MKQSRRRLLPAFRPSPAWLFAFGLLVAHQLWEKAFGLHIEFLDAYLDPFLSIPIFVGLAQAERRWLFKSTPQHAPLHAWQVVGMTIAIAVIGEELLPRLSPAAQFRDPYDYFAYAAGGVATLLYMYASTRGDRAVQQLA